MSFHEKKTDEVSASELVADATTTSFSVVSKKPSQPDVVSDSGVEKRIIELTSKYKLTAEEVCGYLVEKSDIPQTEKELKKILNLMIQQGTLKEELDGLEALIRPTVTPLEEWSEIFRDLSKQWINENTVLNTFFTGSRSTYNNIIKKLSQSEINNYNQVIDPCPGSMKVKIDDEEFLMFSSNNYLGLSMNPDVVKACEKALKQYGNGSGGSRIMTGSTSVHQELEKKICEFKDCEAAVVFGSGFLTNLSLLSVVSSECIVFFDSLCHASIIDGIRLSKASEVVRFKHNNVNDLAKKLSKVPIDRPKLIIVEAVYSLDGDIAPVPKIVELSKTYNAMIAVDEAHSLGTIGNNGKGISEYFGLDPKDIHFKVGTLGKALGASGGYIAGNSRIIEMLKYSARPYLFSTSLPASTMAGALKAFELIEENKKNVADLQEKSKYVRDRLKYLGFDIGNSETQIIPVIVKDEYALHLLQHRVMSSGIFVNAITYPGVPPKKSRLRVSISSLHSYEELDFLIECLENHGKQLGII